jgi:hypothetical protein
MLACPADKLRPSITIPALRHFEHLSSALADNAIDQPMLSVDPPRPPARQIAAEQLGLSGAAKWVARAFLEQRIDPLDD